MRYIPRQFLCVLLALLLAVPLLADTHRWQPKAQAVPQITTITISNTWATDDTATITCNNKSVTVTVGSNTSTADVAAALNAAIMSDDQSTQTADLIGDEQKNIGGRTIAEFTDFTSEIDPNDSSRIKITSAVDGVPFTITTSESTAGSGDVGTPSTTQAATGPWHFDNANNWDVGALPADTDTIRFDSGSGDCLYGIDYARSDPNNLLTFVSHFTTDFTGSIGLPHMNAKGYVEYRNRKLQYAGTVSPTFYEGTQGVTPAGTIRLEFDFSSTGYQTLTIFNTNDLELYGGGNSTIKLYRGNVHIDPDYDPPTTAATFDGGLVIGGRGIPDNETSATIGQQVDSNGTLIAITQYSGIVNWRAALWTDASNYWTVDMYGGRFDFSGTNTELVTIRKGTFRWIGSQGSSIHRDAVEVHTGGTYDLSQRGGAVTYNNGLNAHGGSNLILGGTTPTITFDGCEQSDVNIIR